MANISRIHARILRQRCQSRTLHKQTSRIFQLSPHRRILQTFTQVPRPGHLPQIMEQRSKKNPQNEANCQPQFLLNHFNATLFHVAFRSYDRSVGG